MVHLFSIFAFLLIFRVGINEAYQEPTNCLGSDGTDLGITCVYVNADEYCPPNYYCPTYSYSEATLYMTQLTEFGCTVNANPTTYNTTVQCPCTAGFYCPTNTGQPNYCPNGYYCPVNATSVAILGTPPNGLGAWGSIIIECPSGHFCGRGQVEPFVCSGFGDCPAGSTKENRLKIYIVAVIVLILMFSFSSLYNWRKIKTREARRVLSESSASQLKTTGADATQSRLKERTSAASNGSSGLQAKLMSGGASPGPGSSSSSSSSGAPEALDIEFDDITFVLKDGTTIMQGVTGRFAPGRTCAIMGPSGAGKTTIINLVTGKASKTGGQVKVNGAKLENLKKYKKLIGFVPQEDIMIRDLSCRQNISFSARYRLPASEAANMELMRSKIDKCIRDLGIWHVQDSPIGDERTRGISGGQRKRVNIGLELVADPLVLFLDEPTSGLDSTSSTALCGMLKEIAVARSMTIAAVIHQPSVSAFESFDDLLLLGKGGRTIYHGTIAAAPDYFASIGFPVPVNCNPADFYLDVCQGQVVQERGSFASETSSVSALTSNTGFRPSSVNKASAAAPQNGLLFEWPLLFDMWEDRDDGHEGWFKNPHKSASNLKDKSKRASQFVRQSFDKISKQLSDTGNSSPLSANGSGQSDSSPNFLVVMCSVVVLYFKKLLEQLETWWVFQKEALSALCEGKGEDMRDTPSAFKQFKLCFKRASTQAWFPVSSFLFEMCTHLLVGMMFSGSAKQLYYEGPFPDPICFITPGAFIKTCQEPQDDAYQQTTSLMCFAVLSLGISSAAAIFGHEQVNYFRECAAGLNSPMYFIAKVIANIPKMFFSSVFFWWTFSSQFLNTSSQADMFGYLFLLYWYSYGLGYLLSQFVNIRYTALLGIFISLLISVKLSGVNPSLQEVNGYQPPVQQLPWYISGPRWVQEGFYTTQVDYYDSIPNGPYEGDPYIDINSGLGPLGYSTTRRYVAYTWLFVLGLIMHILAMITMAFGHRLKKL